MIGTFRKQYKGKDIQKLPVSKRVENGWYAAVKFDGQYLQIHKKGNDFWFFTSGGKQLFIEQIAEELAHIDHDFIIECEFNDKGTRGICLNDRTKSSTTKYVTEFKKGLRSFADRCIIHVFDILNLDGDDIRGHHYSSRRMYLNSLFGLSNFAYVALARSTGPMSLTSIENAAVAAIEEGKEGLFAYNMNHTIGERGRSNLAIKVKGIKSKIMKCIGVDQSSTVIGEWGALILRDEDGRVQSFGGLTSEMRRSKESDLKGKEFKVRYEQFTNGKYVQGFIVGDNNDRV